MKLTILCIGFFLLLPLQANANPEDGLTKDQIAQEIRKNMSGVVQCYENELKTHAQLEGKIILSFDIGLDGKIIKSAILNSTLNNSTVDNCVIDKSKTWIFPKPKGSKPVHVEYPFTFKAKKAS